MKIYEQYLLAVSVRKKNHFLKKKLLIELSKTDNGTITPTTVDIILAEQES